MSHFTTETLRAAIVDVLRDHDPEILGLGPLTDKLLDAISKMPATTSSNMPTAIGELREALRDQAIAVYPDFVAAVNSALNELEDLRGQRSYATALAAVAAERARQIAKGYDAAHDDEHKGGEIVMAEWGARARIEAAINAGRSGDAPAYKELLTEAAAQCAAEIERVERAEGKAHG